MAVEPLKFEGKSYPLTVITPIPRWRGWLQRLVHRAFGLLGKYDVKVKHEESLSVVHQLRFIHFARWVVVGRKSLPRLSRRQPKEELPDHLYLFTTNFNGTWDQYIDAFGTIHDVSRGLNMLWWNSADFPGSWPMTPFKRYIHYYEYPLDLYYNAYPGAAVRDVFAARELEPRLLAFVNDTAEEMDDALFGEAFRSLLNEASPYLGQTGATREELPSTHHARPLRSLS